MRFVQEVETTLSAYRTGCDVHSVPSPSAGPFRLSTEKRARQPATRQRRAELQAAIDRALEAAARQTLNAIEREAA